MANNPVPIQNYHEQLIAKCQKDNLEWDFVEGTPTGPAHDRTFSCWYIVNGEKFPEANGKNKKEAKKLAAKNAFELLMARSSNAPQSLIVNDSSKSSNPDLESGDTNYVSRLNEYCLGEGILHQFKEIKQDGPSHLPTFVCCAVVGDKKYKEAEGKNKKAAKQKAAQLALEEMGITPGTIQIVSDSSKSSNPDLENGDTNYIKRLNEYCQRERTAYHFKEIKQDGPSHLPTFVCCAVVGGKEYKEAEGKNKKVAKQKAAQLALEEIGITSCNMQGSSKLEESLKNDQTKCRSKKDIALAPNFSVKPVDKPNQQELDSIEFKEKFQDISELGKGGYGCVFKAKHKVDTKYYAVKKVKLHSGKAVSEVVTLADLNHPNVVRYYTSWQEKAYFYPDLSDTATNSSDNCGILCEALFIQMELCEKGTLKNWIDERRGKDSDKSESLVIFQQIVEGVKYVHSKFLIHRDLKPSNIFLSGEMNIKIGDFGLVTTISIDRDRTKGVGTATYMSPEQKNRSSKYGTEVDIFALGLIFFELLRLYSTDTEKYKDWDRVRNGEFSDDFKAKYPKEVKLLQRMLSETPTTRPLAKDIAQDILSSLTEREPTSVKTC